VSAGAKKHVGSTGLVVGLSSDLGWGGGEGGEAVVVADQAQGLAYLVRLRREAAWVTYV
jgi:hypothetical protein